LPILLLLDGLYPTGPVMEQCRRYHWDYMIVLPQQCLAVADCIRNGPGLQSTHFQDHINCNYRYLQDRINCN
jgi:hypothetical protein